MFNKAKAILLSCNLDNLHSDHQHHHHIEAKAVIGDSKKPEIDAIKQKADLHVDSHSAGHAAAPKSSSEHSTEVHSLIGVALVLGFVFMLLVDQIGGNIHFSRSSSGMS